MVRKTNETPAQYQMDVAESALGMAATARSHDLKSQWSKSAKDKADE
jgi:hypothetical protein